MAKVQLNITYKGKYSYLTDPVTLTVSQLAEYYKRIERISEGASTYLKVSINDIQTYFPEKFLAHCFLSVIILEE